MTPVQTGPNYDARLQRAQALAAAHPFAAEVLRFYVQIAEFQRAFQTQLRKLWQKFPPTPPAEFLRSAPALEPSALLLRFAGLLTMVEKSGPGPLAAAALQMQSLESTSLLEMLAAYRDLGGRSNAPLSAFAQFFPRVFHEPVAEELSYRAVLFPFAKMPSVCPLCGSQPLLGVLRPEGDGGKRWLMCSFCLKEWEYRRLLCPACGEEDEKKLPIYVAEQLPHIRVEACETCKTYLRTIDLTKDGHAVPLVDDLAALPLTLWAQEHGYSRLRPNLLGT